MRSKEEIINRMDDLQELMLQAAEQRSSSSEAEDTELRLLSLLEQLELLLWVLDETFDRPVLH